MLPSCGHFKNISCPFYKLALCVRPHCPYKHQNSDNEYQRQSFSPLLDETESLLDSKVNLSSVLHKSAFQKRTLGRTQESATYIPTPVENSSRPPGILKTNNSSSDRPSTSYVPEYKPTPIAKLKENSTVIKSEYSPEYPTAVRKKKNVEEYDPTEVKCIQKKSVTFVDQSGPDDVPIILISSDDDFDDSASAPKFSDDDLDEEPPSISSDKTQVPEVITIKQEPEEVEESKIDEFSVVDQILVDCKKNERFLKGYKKPVLPSKVNDAAPKVTSTQSALSSTIDDTPPSDFDINNIFDQEVTSNKFELKNNKTDNGTSVKLSKNQTDIPVSQLDEKIVGEKIKIKKEKSDSSSSSSKVKKHDSSKSKIDKHEKVKEKLKNHDSHSKKSNSHSKKDSHSKKSDTHAKKSDSHLKKSDSAKALDSRPKKSFSQLKNIDSVSSHKDKKKDSKDSNNKSKHPKIKISTSENKKSNLHIITLKEDKHTISDKHAISDKHTIPHKDQSSDKKNSKKRLDNTHKTKHLINSPNSKKSKIVSISHLKSESNPSKYKEISNQHKRKHEIEHPHSETNNKRKPISPESKKTKSDDTNSEDDYDLLNDDLSESDPEEECRRIYNETFLESTEVSNELKQQSSSEPNASKAADLVILRKKRYAHPAAIELKKPVKKEENAVAKRPLNPAQVMHNRFIQFQNKFLSENKAVLNSLSKSPDKKRINFAPSQNLLAAVKSKVNPANSALSNFTPLPPTVSKTLKPGKRVAHIPEVAKKPRPIIPADFGSKVPSNIRQKFLNAFIDECVKFCASEDEAYDQALEEEKKAYERSSSKNLYMNVAANALKRLRNIAQEGPKGSNDASQNSSKPKKSVSHETVLNGPIAQRHSFSIGRKKEAPEVKGGAEFYEYLLQYVLTKEQLQENGFPHPHPIDQDRAVISGVYANRVVYCNDAFKRVCCRCQKTYYVNVDGDYVRDEECDFHWGRLWKKRIAGSIESRYSCCQGDSETDGCCVSPGHVFEGSEKHALRGFVKTLPKTPPSDNCYGIYSLDCEMCYTTAGIELTRITVIDTDLKTVYESFVKPQNKVLDYNTRFSGITEQDLKSVRTTIQDVQAVLLCIFNDKTILIGHSLESDFKALKLFHQTVVDTSVVFPHRNGLPFKRALKTLMAEKLNKIIQNDVGGHDSQEDAVACMQLMLWKVKEDIRGNR